MSESTEPEEVWSEIPPVNDDDFVNAATTNDEFSPSGDYIKVDGPENIDDKNSVPPHPKSKLQLMLEVSTFYVFIMFL